MPDAVINALARTIGVEVDDMDVDEEPRGKKGSFESIRKRVKQLMREGYSASQIISQVSYKSSKGLSLTDASISYMTS